MDEYAKLRELWLGARRSNFKVAEEMQRLRDEGKSLRQVAEAIGVSYVTVKNYTDAFVKSLNSEVRFAAILSGIHKKRNDRPSRKPVEPKLPEPPAGPDSASNSDKDSGTDSDYDAVFLLHEIKAQLEEFLNLDLSVLDFDGSKIAVAAIDSIISRAEIARDKVLRESTKGITIPDTLGEIGE